ncbi:MAG TPA: hypothetical protein VHO67_10515 [Polyangia bacterium]|nr:hypothetical protein [Polyangia bacterium]
MLLLGTTRVAAALALAALLGGGAARADGAFPDATNVLLPPGDAQAITLATNFGLISTDDGGKTWIWSCETPLLNGGRSYQIAADARGSIRRIVALSSWGLVHSDDAGCSWSASLGDGQDDAFSDVFVLPAAPVLAWAVGVDPSQSMGLPQVVFGSEDGAASLMGPLFTAAADQQVLGVEPAAAAPSTVYVTLASGPDAPALAVTRDGGGHWETTALANAVGSGYLRIIAVDPTDARVVLLRQSTAAGDRLLITRDGGLTWDDPLVVSGSLSAFLRRSDGTLLVGVLQPDGTAAGYRSFDAGHTFAPWPGVPHLRALAEREGVVFAAADDVQDGFALAASTDGGDTFEPRLRYGQVGGVAPCVRDACAATCQRLAAMQLWPAATCTAAASGATGDAGAPADGAAPSDAGGRPPAGGGGAGCAVGGMPGQAGTTRAGAVLLLVLRAFRRRFPRR